MKRTIESLTPPENKQVIWLDVSGKIKQFKVYNNGEWIVINDDTENNKEIVKKVLEKIDKDFESYIKKEDADNTYATKTDLNKKVDVVAYKGLSTNDFTNGYRRFLEELSCNIKNLGHFNTEAAAINYLKTLPLCADTRIIHAHLTYGDNDNPNTITLIQNVTASWTRQVLFRGDKIQQRAIYFTNDNRTEIRRAEDLQPLFGDRLKWDNNGHKYLLSQFNDNFNGQYTDPIPMVSTTTDGLMSKEDKGILNNLNSWNYIGILSSWNNIAKLTTESTETDILNTLAVTPLRGDKITTKYRLFAILDRCAINKKFLKESSTNANVFVNHIGSCYVIYILGNKASVLNGRLVGTLVLRSITITANSNETLAVLKNPLEINLEDINKKVTNLELEVEKIKEKVAKDLSK